MNDKPAPDDVKESKQLRKHCIAHDFKGNYRNNDYPYGEHLRDCDICQAAEKINNQAARIAELEARAEKAEQQRDALAIVIDEAPHEPDCNMVRHPVPPSDEWFCNCWKSQALITDSAERCEAQESDR